MRSISSSLFSTWRVLALVVSLLALLVLAGVGAIPATARGPDVALVGLELPDDSALGDLVALDLSFYTQFYTQDGRLLLLIPADKSLRRALASRGYALQILDKRGGQAQYYLLYGLPEALDKASSQVELLLVQGRQAVARASSAQAQEVAGLGIQILPLQPRPLVAPPPQAQALAMAPKAITPDPLVQTMINQVATEKIYQYVGDLSGVWAAPINNDFFTLTTRYSYASTYITKATRYAYEHFLGLGLPVTYQYYYISSTQERNVIAEQTGLNQPQRLFLITAHIDSTSGSPYTNAPGADDNASGTAGVMLAADILSQYKFDCTLRYALFTGEEQGLYGADAYATYLKNQGAQLEGVLNLDMISYNSLNSTPSMELHTRPSNSNDLVIANTFKDVISAYGFNLTPYILQDGLGFSDHAPFWYKGYPAILAIEDWTDHTPYYHTTNDRLASLNMPYFTEFVKASLATFAHMGCLLEGTLTGVVRDALTNNPLPGAMIRASTEGARSWATFSGADGSYVLPLPPGDYELYVTLPLYQPGVQSGVQIVHTQTTPLDLFLQPVICPCFNNLPLVADADSAP